MNATRFSAVPFTLKRSSDLWDAHGGYESTTETAHGLVRLEADQLVIQWRIAVQTEKMGDTWETSETIEPVKEIVIPLAKVAGAAVPPRRWWHIRGPRLVIAASDLLAFEKIAGEQGLKLKHPAKMVLRIKRPDRLLAEEFAAELSLAMVRLPADPAENEQLASPARHAVAPGQANVPADSPSEDA
ncbi:MAG: hypothetical protein F4X22_13095 [Gemmatimonadales bacterium]|uniref:hypothetical protein n=1 Tax=Candidatus Palauibacter polyketidifaciens TaxID=3056740 RepID=UPI0013F9EA4B|nr:hypothetical protein [Candidatus Palauibacter polyketidifaciens]MDE2720156.1 hypothetical protein [Candidatus Palauibacter polyketidifaciens]MYC89152.1 hypothetical protein [Candidatus Palauibacter denitrificans]